MKNLKFNINKGLPSNEEIDKHKDFNKLLYNYQKATQPIYKTPLYKSKKVFLVVLLIGLIIYLIVSLT